MVCSKDRMIDVEIYLAALSGDPYEKLTDGDQDCIREVHLHLRDCQSCRNYYIQLKGYLASEDIGEGNLAEQDFRLISENEKTLNQLVQST